MVSFIYFDSYIGNIKKKRVSQIHYGAFSSFPFRDNAPYDGCLLFMRQTFSSINHSYIPLH